MNTLLRFICNLLMIPASFSYYSPISKWVKNAGSHVFFQNMAANVKWKLIRKRGLSRALVGKPYALATACLRLGSMSEAWTRIYKTSTPSLAERFLSIIQETEDVELSPQWVRIPAEWRYKNCGAGVSNQLYTGSSSLSPDFRPIYASPAPITIPDVENEIGVVIPVYNGKQHLEVLLPSLFRNTKINHKFIFVNDCSPDTTVLPWLKLQCEGRSDCLILENETNLGFPATVNNGAEHCKGHFVILNTDTEVPSDWLERLMAPIWNSPQVASVTPFSDAATIFSFPLDHQDDANQLFLKHFGLEKIDQVMRENATPASCMHAPTGTGFCMAINREVWNQIGGLDAETFGKGYGEENDWCQRAIKAGYQNILNPNLYVAHYHGGSFESDKKKMLMASAAQKISLKHPKYHEDVRAFIAADPWKGIRAASIIRLLMCEQCSHPLYLTFAWGGGATEYLKSRLQDDLATGECPLVLTYDRRENEYNLDLYFNSFHFTFKNISRDLLLTSEFRSINTIYINHLATWDATNNFHDTTQWVLTLKRHLHCRLVHLAHDHFPLCPGITMLTKGLNLCPLQANECDCSQCPEVNPLWQNSTLSLNSWRDNWGALLLCCDEVRCFSNSTANYFKRHFTGLDNKVTIVPHARQLISAKKLTPCTEQLNICVVGAINEIKGSRIVSEVARLLEKSHPEATIFIIGEWYGAELRPNMKLVPRYDKKHLLDILHYVKATLCLFPSICPETFSYVISELMELEAPIISFNLGAQGERLVNYPKAVLVGEISPNAIVDAIETQLISQ